MNVFPQAVRVLISGNLHHGTAVATSADDGTVILVEVLWRIVSESAPPASTYQRRFRLEDEGVSWCRDTPDAVAALLAAQALNPPAPRFRG